MNQHFILQRTSSPCLFRDTKPGRARTCCITQGSNSSQFDSSPQPSQILEPAQNTHSRPASEWADRVGPKSSFNRPRSIYPLSTTLGPIPACQPQPCLSSSSELPHNPWDVIDFKVYKAHLLTQACTSRSVNESGNQGRG